ncbi:hypothetical protein CHUAL_003328 [Chamberlinius hualienensis]
MADDQREVSYDEVGTNIQTCRRRIQILQQNLTKTLDLEKRSEIQVQLRRLGMILDKQERAFQRSAPPKPRSLATNIIIVVLLVFALIYFIIMLVMQALLPANK